jgi:FkbM family methyltransferase
MKHLLLRALYGILGFENYLHLSNLVKVRTVAYDKRKTLYFKFINMLPTDANVLVVGANTGWSTIPIARHVAKGKVFAFEPGAENYRALNKIVAHTAVPNVQTFPYAMGDADKKIQMSMPIVKGVKSYGMTHLVDKNINYFDKGITFETDMRTLDGMMPAFGNQLNAIKLIAENSEQYILKGGWETILKHKPLFYCELWENDHRLRVLAIIKSFGYAIKILDQHNELVPYPGESYTDRPFIFIPPTT